MINSEFKKLLTQELDRIDNSGTARRHENVIDGFSNQTPPQALINKHHFRIFNSNDYLGLRHHPDLKSAEHAASLKFGAGPGAVRFISGSLSIHRDLEQALAKFHGREDAMVFSSAFAANMGVISSLVKGLSKDSLVTSDVLVISDQLNHRSIVDGVRVAGLTPEQKQIFVHKNPQDLSRILEENVGKFSRALVISDGVFSMLGEFQNLSEIQQVINNYAKKYPLGIVLLVDDAHGAGAFGSTGRGTPEVSGSMPDVLVSTLGKAFGADGGYVVGDHLLIEYLRETAATYIYSNSISPGTAGAALKSLELVSGLAGKTMLKHLSDNIELFKTSMHQQGFNFAADSFHPIQPILIGDPQKTLQLTESLFDKGFLVTNISYPVVPKGSDEIRVQISAAHTTEDINSFVKAISESLLTR
jgi:glycine C-acetyltransferase